MNLFTTDKRITWPVSPVDEENSVIHTWWELTLKLRHFLEFNGVFSLNNPTPQPRILAFNSKECGIISLNFSQQSSFWSLRLRPDLRCLGIAKRMRAAFGEEKASVQDWTLATLCLPIATISLFPAMGREEFKESVSISKADWG